MIGIIIPPGQIKKLVEKTAQHVAANGLQFEKMILQRQHHNAEFTFLHNDNPYRAYYDHMVAEISRKMLQEAQQTDLKINTSQLQEQAIKQTFQLQIEEPKNQQAQFLERVFEQVVEPDPERFTAALPQKITQAEISIIQHTAQYVAKIGKDFLVALSERQKSNPQFEFLKKSSNNYEYFVKIYTAYQNLLNFSEEDILKLEETNASKDSIFAKCQQAFQYHSLKQKQLKGKSEFVSDESKKQSNIDWNDYEIVETILFDNLKTKSKNLALNANTNQIQKAQFPMLEEKIVSAPKKKQILQQCHICHHNILASQMTKHLKTCLSQKKRSNPTDSHLNQHDEVDIRKNLESLSTKRPDIFGGDAAKIVRKQIDDEDQSQQKIIWDGQAPNMSRVTASIAMVNNQQRKINENSKQN